MRGNLETGEPSQHSLVDTGNSLVDEGPVPTNLLVNIFPIF